MPSLNILSWNTHGESHEKAIYLDKIVTYLKANNQWTPDVVFIQGAHVNPNGEVYRYLKSCTLFKNPVAHVPAGGGSGCSYLMAVAPHVTITKRFSSLAFLHDKGVQRWIDSSFDQDYRKIVTAEVAEFCNLGVVEIDVEDSSVRLATWHAHRGYSCINSHPSRLRGDANPDAYLVLEASDYYNDFLTDLGNVQVSSICGDLSIYHDDLGRSIKLFDKSSYTVLENWTGNGSKIDNITALFKKDGYVTQGLEISEHENMLCGLSGSGIVGGTIVW